MNRSKSKITGFSLLTFPVLLILTMLVMLGINEISLERCILLKPYYGRLSLLTMLGGVISVLVITIFIHMKVKKKFYPYYPFIGFFDASTWFIYREWVKEDKIFKKYFTYCIILSSISLIGFILLILC